MARFPRRLQTLPRFVYWLIGGTLAIGGAVAGRQIAQSYPPDERVTIWLAGAAVVFVGLAVISLGTRSRLEEDGDETASPPQ